MTDKCFITGSSGFLGLRLHVALRGAGFEVRCLDRQPAGIADEIVGDILDNHALEKACTGIHAVCHLAALQSSREYSWEDFYAVNVRGTESVLRACMLQNVRHVVFFSTEMVYGCQTTCRVEEDAALNPRGFYARSKLMAEELCRKYMDRGLQITIVRPCNIMGPGKRRVVDKLFDRIRTNAFLPLVGGKHRPCQFIDVRDLANITAQIVKRRVPGIYNIGTSHPPSTFQVLSSLIRYAHSQSKLVSVPARLTRTGFRILDALKLSPLTEDQYYRLAESWIVDSSKLYDLLKYSLKYDEVRSIIDTYDAYCTSTYQPA